MRKWLIMSFKSLNWKAIVIPGVILTLELLITSLMRKHEKSNRYSEYSHKRIT